MRVIVIGSGIAGLSAALALRRVGINVTVYERAAELREVGAGISLWANALRALDYLGVGDAIRGVSLGLDRSELRTNEGRRVRAGFAGAEFERKVGVRPFVAMIHRAELVNALAGFLPAEVSRFGYECTSVSQNGNRVSVRFANGHTDQADLVIGADGIKSAVRSNLFGPEEPRYAGYTCWRGICPRPLSITPGYVGEWWGRGQRIGITTLTHDRVYWFAVQNAPANHYFADTIQVVANLFQAWADPVPNLIASTPADHLVNNDIMDRPPINSWSKGRIGLIGDAAHSTTPNLGQGGCTAIEDAVVLARNLKECTDPAEALNKFCQERSRRTAKITNESWRFGKIAQWEGRLSCWVRDTALGLGAPLFGRKHFAKYPSFDVGPLPS